MNIQVETYSGYRSDERPLRFYLDDAPREVDEIIDRWYGPGYSYFKVRDREGCLYILRHDEERDLWGLTFYEKIGSAGRLAGAGALDNSTGAPFCQYIQLYT